VAITIDPNRSLEDLLKDLEGAVAQRDLQLATSIHQAILQRLVADDTERDAIERQTRALMEKLAAQPTLPQTKRAAIADLSFETELSVESDADRQSGGVIYPVWFATNRKANPGGGGFGSDRANAITYGHLDVSVPDAHRFGETGTGFLKHLLRFDFRDDVLRVQRVEKQDRDTFFAEIRNVMQNVPESNCPPEALVFIHGFNVTFEDAAIRSAQIGVDLRILPGGTGFFSWPSKGDVRAYPADEATIEASECAIAEFLIDFTSNCGAKKVHLIAHSMGNRGLLRALQRIAANAEAQSKVKFGQIFLAAPDLDRDLFLDLAYLYPKYSERTTLYASNGDLPVHLSSKIHDAPRAGYFLPYTLAPNIDTICVPDFDIDLLGHGYFAQAEALLYDIGDLIRTNETLPRQRIEAMKENGQDLWRFKR
jgi:esterase/lipase superfamily enzyme